MKKVFIKSVPVRFFLFGSSLLLSVMAGCEKEKTTPPVVNQANYTTADVAGTYTMTKASWSSFVGGDVGSKWIWTAVSKDSLNDGYINIGLTPKGGGLSAPPQLLKNGTNLIVSFNGTYSPKTISGTFTIKNGTETSFGLVVMEKP